MFNPSARVDAVVSVVVAVLLVVALVIGKWWVVAAMVLTGMSIGIRHYFRRRHPERYDPSGRLRRPG